MTNVPKAVIFDLYGVLGLNGWQAFKDKHFAHRREDWQKIRLLGKQVDAGSALQSEFIAAISIATGEEPSAVQYQLEHTIVNRPLLEFIRTKLTPICKVAILSNASRDVMPGIFTEDELKLFDDVVSSYSVGLTKPDPQMFLLVCEHLAVTPADCLYVDDQVRHVEAAKKLGMAPVFYTSAAQCIAHLNRVLKR